MSEKTINNSRGTELRNHMQIKIWMYAVQDCGDRDNRIRSKILSKHAVFQGYGL